jgi:hypothetical protein
MVVSKVGVVEFTDKYIDQMILMPSPQLEDRI